MTLRFGWDSGPEGPDPEGQDLESATRVEATQREMSPLERELVTSGYREIDRAYDFMSKYAAQHRSPVDSVDLIIETLSIHGNLSGIGKLSIIPSEFAPGSVATEKGYPYAVYQKQ